MGARFAEGGVVEERPQETEDGVAGGVEGVGVGGGVADRAD